MLKIQFHPTALFYREISKLEFSQINTSSNGFKIEDERCNELLKICQKIDRDYIETKKKEKELRHVSSKKDQGIKVDNGGTDKNESNDSNINDSNIVKSKNNSNKNLIQNGETRPEELDTETLDEEKENSLNNRDTRDFNMKRIKDNKSEITKITEDDDKKNKKTKEKLLITPTPNPQDIYHTSSLLEEEKNKSLEQEEIKKNNKIENGLVNNTITPNNTNTKTNITPNPNNNTNITPSKNTNNNTPIDKKLNDKDKTSGEEEIKLGEDIWFCEFCNIDNKMPNYNCKSKKLTLMNFI